MKNDRANTPSDQCADADGHSRFVKILKKKNSESISDKEKWLITQFNSG